MSLSSSGSEIKQIEMHALPDNDTVELAIDAQEDREIVGFEWSLIDAVRGNPHELEAEAYVGVDPSPTVGANEGDVKDVGGKFHTHANSQVSTDGAGFGYAIQNLPNVAVDSEMSWDWNEDVTLSAEFTEEVGNGPVSTTLNIWYREV